MFWPLSWNAKHNLALGQNYSGNLVIKEQSVIFFHYFGMFPGELQTYMAQFIHLQLNFNMIFPLLCLSL